MQKVTVIICLILFISCKNSDSSAKQNVNNQQKNDSVTDIQMAPIEPDIVITRSDSSKLMTVWRKVMKALKENNYNLSTQYSLDTIYCQACSSFPRGTEVETIPIKYISFKNFLSFYRDSFPNSKKLKENNDSSNSISLFAFKLKRPTKYTGSSEELITIYRILFSNMYKSPQKYSYEFYFIKEKNTFRFFGLYL